MANDRSYAELNDQFSFLRRQYNVALASNIASRNKWEEFKKGLEEVSENLSEYSKHLKCPIMVPIGKKAFMKGDLVHTNECLVCLGDGWFVKQSASQTKEFCSRRSKDCDEMLEKLKKEMDLLESRQKIPFESEAFAQGNTQEILEPYDEEAEANWRIQHREKEKAYRKTLAEERKKQEEPKEIDVWERLKALELQESTEIDFEKQDDASNENDEYLESDDYSTDSLSDEFVEEEEDEEEEEEKETRKLEVKQRPSVSFNFQEDNSDERLEDDVIVISVEHTVTDSTSSSACTSDSTDKTKIEKPSDIYRCFPHLFKPKSILKKSSSYSKNFDEPVCSNITDRPRLLEDKISPILNDVEASEFPQQVFGDIIEHNEVNVPVEPLPPTTTARKVSKFKASRKAAS